MKLSDKNITVLALALIVIGSGVTPVTIKIGVAELSPEILTFLRFSLASLILAPLFFKSGPRLNKDFGILILISLLLTVNILAFSHGLRTTTATIGQLLYALSPIFVVIFSYFLVRDKITSKKILGIVLGIIGTGIVLILPAIDKGNPFSGDLIGNLLVMIGVISTSLHVSFSQKLHLKFSPIQIAMAFFLTTAIISFILALPQFLESGRQLLNVSPKAILAVAYVGLIGTPVLYVATQYAIKHGSPLIASTNFFLVPFSTVIWAYFLVGERLTPFLAVGGIIVLLGTYFIVSSKKSN
jgi:drug/metabolite transporter (DMT)-like permease